MAKTTNRSRLPCFLCVGAQKAGTTTLQKLLGNHPNIYLPAQKELHFFSLHYNKGLSWYGNHFLDSSDKSCIGEITPYYLFHPYAAQRIYNTLGSIRIIILLRDPLARTISHYGHSRHLGFEDLSLEEALKAESQRLEGADITLLRPDGVHQKHQECSYLSRSLYRSQVHRYFKYFGRENICILPSEFLFLKPWESLQIIYQFLQIESHSKPDSRSLGVRANAGKFEKHKYKSDFLTRLRRELNDSYEFVNQELGWDHSIPWSWHN
tara:strand:+ start:778 stop:1575 length:798 start_codon:yes stop_codon:yes gene_type:complete